MNSSPQSPPRKPPKKRELAAWLERTQPARIGELEWDALRELLAPISESYLRRLLRDLSRDSGLVLAPMVEGVRQETFDALESSLTQLLTEYESGDAARRSRVRALVIAAKDHAKLAARIDHKRVVKNEMVLWMLTWLENPPLFPKWARLRRKAGDMEIG